MSLGRWYKSCTTSVVKQQPLVEVQGPVDKGEYGARNSRQKHLLLLWTKRERDGETAREHDLSNCALNGIALSLNERTFSH